MQYALATALALFTVVPAYASEFLHCQNPATGAELVITSAQSGASFQFNEALVSALQAQGSAAVLESGKGAINYGPGLQLFTAGAAKGFSLSVANDMGGVKLEYRPYASRASEFYFNPGECQ